MKKNFLKEISEEEKNFILEMHKNKGYNTLNERYLLEDENQDVYNSLNKDPSARNIARVIRNSNGGYLGDDKEAWAEVAFNKISNMKTYNDVSIMLGKDVIDYLQDFMDINDTYYRKSINSHYDVIKQTAVKTSNLKPTTFTGKAAESIAKSYYNSVGKNISIWQMLLKLNGQNLGNYGPNRDGIDGQWGGTSRKALKAVTGSSDLNFDNFKKLVVLISGDEKKVKQFRNFVESSSSTIKKTKEVSKDKPTSKDNKSGISNQVQRQLDYLSSANKLEDEKFTILDDKNNKVHCFEPGYKLLKTYDVISGRDVGDDLKTETMGDWVLNNKGYVWNQMKDTLVKTFSSLFSSDENTNNVQDAGKAIDDLAKNLDNCYFNQEEWRIRNTPSGVFERAGVVENFMNDWIATAFMEKDYGKRFITWETLEGDTIPFGFHGTKNDARLKVLDAQDLNKQSCKKRNMSFGCINFKEQDILEIDKFINSGQKTIWLPDASDDIVKWDD
jgi:hypothetical protein